MKDAIQTVSFGEKLRHSHSFIHANDSYTIVKQNIRQRKILKNWSKKSKIKHDNIKYVTSIQHSNNMYAPFVSNITMSNNMYNPSNIHNSDENGHLEHVICY